MRRPAILLCGLGLLYALAAATVDPWTALAYATVAVPVVAVLALAVHDGWLRPRAAVDDGGADPAELGTTGRHARAGLVVWAVLLFVIVYWQLMVFTSNPRDVYPTYSSILNELLAPYPARVAGWSVWLWLGWYVVRR
jgi:hypothetical protein